MVAINSFMKKNQIDIITMGCSKNLVDSEILMKQFEANGYECVHDPQIPQGEIAVINTCGFIETAKEESINTILNFANRKNNGQLSRLYVMGCLSQRYKTELEKEIPEVDKFYGKFNYKSLLTDLGKAEVKLCNEQRHLTTPSHYAYIKIAEGCDRRCAYCAIPLITGKHRSRPMKDILKEVKELSENNVKEFQIIEQELTYYGIDIDGKHHIAELIREMVKIKKVEWIRLHYAYPNQFPIDLLDVINESPKVCKYLDVALQHISDNMLKRMRRNVTKEDTINFIKTIRKRVPNIHIRTTLLVGFPGETEKDFEELLEFVKWAKFERMGAFAYSHEEGTYAYEHYKDDIPNEVKQERLDKLMEIQQEISTEIESKKIGKILKTIIDRKEGEFYIGRSEFCSPEVDPEILVKADKKLYIGNFYNVKITNSDEFDLYGYVI